MSTCSSAKSTFSLLSSSKCLNQPPSLFSYPVFFQIILTSCFHQHHLFLTFTETSSPVMKSPSYSSSSSSSSSPPHNDLFSPSCSAAFTNPSQLSVCTHTHVCLCVWCGIRGEKRIQEVWRSPNVLWSTLSLTHRKTHVCWCRTTTSWRVSSALRDCHFGFHSTKDSALSAIFSAFFLHLHPCHSSFPSHPHIIHVFPTLTSISLYPPTTLPSVPSSPHLKW